MILRSLALLALLAPVASFATPADGEIAAYRALTGQDLRLATIGYNLAKANAPFCKDKQRNPGWVLHDIAQYPDTATAKAAFGFDMPVEIAAVVPGGAADQAGLKAGDGFIALRHADIDWSQLPSGKASYDRMAMFRAMLSKSWEAGGPSDMRMERSAEQINVVLNPLLVCASNFQVDIKDKVDAGADGEMVSVNLGLMTFVSDDQELAAAVAHELAHNILHHRARLKALGKKSAKAIRATEVEADRLSVWLLANAGYDLDAAMRFWDRYGSKYDGGILRDDTHPGWKTRVAVMKAEIALMGQVPKTDGLRKPPLIESVDP